MNPETLEKVLNCRDLPTLPAVAMRVVELTNSDRVSMKDLAETIQNDQALAAKVLRTVNSSLFGLRTRCSGINQAIVMLGLSTVKTLALGFSLVGAISNSKTGGFDLADHWRRSLYTAIAAKTIGTKAGIPNPEEAFLGGLLQDVGMIAMVQSLGLPYLQAIEGARGDHRKVCKLELDAFETHHPDIGALLARKWKLPESLVMPIKFHERATAAPVEHGPVCRCVALGNIASDVLTSSEPSTHLRKFYERCSQWFNLSPSQADDILKAISTQTRELAGLLSVPTGQICRADEVVEQARKRLEQMPIQVRLGPSSGAEFDSNEESGTDELTGVADRFSFEQSLVASFEQTRAGVGPIALLLFEIDGFDSINSNYGPDAADSTLIWLAGRLERGFEGLAGLVGRFEGPRFAVLVSRTDRAQVLKVCEMVRTAIASEPLQLIAAKANAPSHISVTCSVGVGALDRASLERFENPAQLVSVVEQALQAANRAGTNSVRVFAPMAAAA